MSEIVDMGCIRRRDGCRIKDLSGLKSGMLTVTDKWETRFLGKRKKAFWLCDCDCGKSKWIEASVLRSGLHKSCGCRRGKSLGDGVASRNRVLRRYKFDAKKRNLAFNLSVDEFTALSTGKCFYCGCEPNIVQKAEGNHGDWIRNGIDRVDNDVGYEKDNCVSCCSVCNYAKGEMSKKDFLVWIKMVYNHRKLGE